MSPKSYSDGYLNSTSSVRTEFLVGTGVRALALNAPRDVERNRSRPGDIHSKESKHGIGRKGKGKRRSEIRNVKFGTRQLFAQRPRTEKETKTHRRDAEGAEEEKAISKRVSGRAANCVASEFRCSRFDFRQKRSAAWLCSTDAELEETDAELGFGSGDSYTSCVLLLIFILASAFRSCLVCGEDVVVVIDQSALGRVLHALERYLPIRRGVALDANAADLNCAAVG
jgi:hypothetical protein